MVSLSAKPWMTRTLSRASPVFGREFGERGAISPAHAALAASTGTTMGAPWTRSCVFSQGPRPSGPASARLLSGDSWARGGAALVDWESSRLRWHRMRCATPGGGRGHYHCQPQHAQGQRWKFLTGVAPAAPTTLLRGHSCRRGPWAGSWSRSSGRGRRRRRGRGGGKGRSLDDAFAALLRSGSRQGTRARCGGVHGDHRPRLGAGCRTASCAGLWGLFCWIPMAGRRPGSTRCAEYLGVRVYEMNAELSRPSHPIDTDSVSPERGARADARCARCDGKRSAVRRGFDYDADRGNWCCREHHPMPSSRHRRAVRLTWRYLLLDGGRRPLRSGHMGWSLRMRHLPGWT